MAEKQAKASASVKSGHEVPAYAEKVCGGIPDKKSVEQIDKVHRPGKAPGSVRA